MEVIVAVLILGIALVGVASALTNGLGAIRRAKNICLASNACRQEMETIRNTPFNVLQNLEYPPDVQFNVAELSGATGMYRIEPYGSSQIEEVTVTVSWNEGENTVAKSLTTLVTRFGINPD